MRNRVLGGLWLAAVMPLGGQITGREVPQLAALDRAMPAALARHGVPGGALAVVRAGKLIYARGFGWADTAARLPVQPDSLFRAASVSKPITATAALRLVEDRRLKLDDPVLRYLDAVLPSGFRLGDERIAALRVRDLLQHSGGWDRDASFDPMFRSTEIAAAMREPAPASCATIIRYMFARRLDFAPGTRAAYSNFGYCVLARVIEAAAGERYEAYVQREVLQPLGIRGMRIGGSLEAQRAPNEVRYYDYRPSTRSVFPGGSSNVPWPYGGFYLEAMDASGGWLASAVDLARFGDASRSGVPVQLLAPETRTAMLRDPGLAFSNLAAGYHYGLGWFVRTTAAGRWWLHGGSMPGTQATLVVSRGLTWAWLFNGSARDEAALTAEIENVLYALERDNTDWPAHDLFPSFHPPDAGRPEFAAGQLVNAASFSPGTSPGAWVTILGARLAAAAQSWSAEDLAGGALPRRLGGVRCTFNGRPAALAYVSEGQLNLLAPLPEEPESEAWVQVFRDGVPGEPRRVVLEQRAPALFGYPAGGFVFAAALHPDGALAGDPLLTPGSRAARGGDQIALYGTGMMAAPADRLLEAPVPLDEAVSVRVGSVAAAVEYAGTVSPGLQQVNIVVPAVPPGDYPVELTVAGRTSNRQTLRVR